MSERKGHERYKIIRECGEGGMGKIYLAEDLNLKRRVALKQAFESTDTEVLKVAEKEARTLANLKHPNLPTVYDYFVENNVQFIVMEYITGKNLGEIMKINPSYFTAAKIAETMTTLLNVVDYLHRQNPPIIHRDIKPQNIKISDDGGLYLLDFGLVKNAGLHSSNSTNLVLSSKLFGFSQGYSPLEQRKGEQTSAAADVYSLCATLYFLYTGTSPADSLDRADIRSKGQPDPLRDIRLLNSNIPTRVMEMIMAGLELHCENRPPAIRGLRRILEGGATRIPNAEPDFQSNAPNFQQFHSSRFQVSFHNEPKKVEETRSVFPHTAPQKSGKKSWLAYAVSLLLIIGALGFFGYENWC